METLPIREKNKKEEIGDIRDIHPNGLNDFFEKQYNSGDLEKYLDKIAEEPSVIAHISYWEKYLNPKYKNLFEEMYKEKVLPEIKNSELPLALEKRFSEKELKMIFEDIQTIQLTFGCSKGCKFCGLDAVPGVSDHIPFEQLKNFFSKYGKELSVSEPFLYYASEPADYRSEDKEGRVVAYKDVEALAHDNSGYIPTITTREINDESWLNFLGERTNKEDVRVSVYGKFKDVDIPDQIDASKTLIYKHDKIPLGKDITRENQEGSLVGIGCFDGILVTPRGIYNVMQIPVSIEYPQGQMIVPLREISKEPICIGQSFESVLSCAVLQNNVELYVDRFLIKPYVTVETGAGMFDIVLDNELNVKNVIPSDEKVEELMGRMERFRKLRRIIISKDKQILVDYLGSLEEGDGEVLVEICHQISGMEIVDIEDKNKLAENLISLRRLAFNRINIKIGEFEDEIGEYSKKQKDKLGPGWFDSRDFVLGPNSNFYVNASRSMIQVDSDGKKYFRLERPGDVNTAEILIYPPEGFKWENAGDFWNIRLLYGSRVKVRLIDSQKDK
ncbi:MAG: hypothetical protein UT05_C0004G0034 [Parcubacteria group bacterium GW2011_GWF2_38_76]|nr:MAG: hypothetical protein UT05_C0004G0034 [Parcubacteria group bacterium GW2011_GWF2_38_76]HBM45661.1 hypothetical protein [Patescibacteria group bacterium]